MHDPMAVAFDLWILTIWHVDPELDGTEDSCWRGKPFRWGGWRWHFWHWKIQFHPVDKLKRLLFSRCARCGRRFRWGEPTYGGWDGTGPLWFRSESDVYHEDCT